jgi:outer membrane receptor protein involved in Fe transport
MSRHLLVCLAAAMPMATHAVPARAETEAVDAPLATAPREGEVSAVYVWGRRESLIGRATSASEGDVSFAAYADRPMLRPGELAEVIPGLAVTQHSGTGKANQYFLRGFNLDHGTDFSVSFDGVPLNLRTHAHGQGYLDLNGVTPEFVEAIDYRKGPYSAQVGDFSAAGSAGFRTFERFPENFLEAQGGENGFGRLVAGLNLPDERGLVGLDLQTGDGPWDNGERLRHASALGRLRAGDWSISALGYGSSWRSTDQVPLRAIEAGTISRLGAIDPTDGGRTSRFILAAHWRPDEDREATVYVQKYRVKLWSNFTYFLDDPIRGDQFEQAEDRWTFGGSASKAWRPEGQWAFKVGGEARYDRIGKIGLYRTQARRRVSTDRDDRVKEASAGVWSEALWSSGPARATFGLRADVIDVDVRSDNAANSGSRTQGFVSPKLALAYQVSPTVEVYADVGRGYHSNDARGAVATVAPVSLDPIEPVSLFAAATGGEIGARYERGGLTASTAIWALNLDSELVYSGDGGDTEVTSGSRRVGVEALLNWTVRPGLNLDVSGALTRARYRTGDAGGDRIPNALDYVLTAGATVAIGARGTAQLTVRRLGPAALIEDNSARSSSANVANLSFSYRFTHAKLSIEALNVLDSRDNDITYFYASRLPGEPAEGVEDYHVHPLEPRQVRASVRYVF